ncbi:MAG: thiamine-phosphate kinase [Pyrinomonadaceae bacterium]|nr:thiamine-phosphate kinase [Pyrinomonadaceae bacterium]MBP6213598.1 thiamine-phosphate kinase [Pyrinomonadaceae bacterium]
MVSEFEFINNIKSRYGLAKIGDDCAVLPKDAKTDLLLTADLLVEDIDFRVEWVTPELLGHKALAVSLSDIAAMGGKPSWAMLSIGIPENRWQSDFLDRFYDGWFTESRKWHVELIGGDVSRTPDKVVIDSIVGGEVKKGRAILRSTANPGDAIFVTGRLGGAAGALKLLEDGARIGSNSTDGLLSKQLQPQPQLAAAKLLQELGIVTAMIDVSDGLSSDLGHICRASGTGAQISLEYLLINPDLREHFPSEVCFDLALNGGEDFELLFTVSEKNISQLDSRLFTKIGLMTGNPGVIQISIDGKTSGLKGKGYRHF